MRRNQNRFGSAFYADFGFYQNLLWQSPALPVTQTGWISTPVSHGTPGQFFLAPGNYTLVWQCDADENVPSFTPGNANDGIQLPLDFGPFAASIKYLGRPITSYTNT